MTDRTIIDAEYEAIKAESVEKVRKALKVITSYSMLFDASGNITEAGRNALGEVEGLDLFWIVDPMIMLAKHRPTEEITEEQAINALHHHGWLVVRSEHKAEAVEPRIEYGTDGQPYKLSMTNGKEYERPQGEWIYHDKLDMYYCKDCGLLEPFTKGEIEEGIKLPNFCQQCGADMRKGGTE